MKVSLSHRSQSGSNTGLSGTTAIIDICFRPLGHRDQAIYKFYLCIQKLCTKTRCFSLGKSRGVEEARQEVKEHGQKNSTLQWGEIFLEGTSILIWIFMCFHKISMFPMEVREAKKKYLVTLTINIKMFLHKEFHPIVLFSFAMIPKRGLTNNSYTGQAEAAGPSLKIYRNKCTCRYADLNIVVVCTCTT